MSAALTSKVTASNNKILKTLAAACLPALLATALLATETLFAQGSSRKAPKKILIRAGYLHQDPAQGMKFPSILLVGGKISQIQKRDSKDSSASFADQADESIDLPGSVVTAGFIDLHCTIGGQERPESAESFTPELDASEAYDPFFPGWRKLARKGICSLVIAPGNGSVAGGMASFVKPGCDSLKNDGSVPANNPLAKSYLKFSLTRDMASSAHRPTNLLGAIDYLNENFDKLKSAKMTVPTPSLTALATVLGGNQQVGIACQTVAEINAALKLGADNKLNFFLLLSKAANSAPQAKTCIAGILEAGVAVAIPALGYSSSLEEQRLPGLLDKAGIKFVFIGESDQESAVSTFQWSLACAVRNGVLPAKALATVTTEPARLAGVGATVGSIFEGRDADLCIWSGEPWDLRSRLLYVIRNGVVIYKAASNKHSSKADKSTKKSEGTR